MWTQFSTIWVLSRCQTLCQVPGIQKCREQSLPQISLCSKLVLCKIHKQTNTQYTKCLNKYNGNKGDGIIKSSRMKPKKRSGRARLWKRDLNEQRSRTWLEEMHEQRHKAGKAQGRFGHLQEVRSIYRGQMERVMINPGRWCEFNV